MTNATKNKATTDIITHLTELRSRFIVCVLTFIPVFTIYYYFSNSLYHYLAIPLLAKLPFSSHFIATNITAPFLVPLKLTFALSFFTLAPFILFQLWSFIAPGLYLRERKLTLPLIISSMILFYSGILFTYFVVLPLLFSFFTRIIPEDVIFMPDINAYLSFVLKLFYAFGIAFEVPIAIVICTYTGLTRVETLKNKRPYFIVAAFIVGMVLTPPDIISQLLLAIPICLLFEIGLLAARILTRSTTARNTIVD